MLGLLGGVSGAVVGLPLANLIHRVFVSYGTVPDAIRLARGLKISADLTGYEARSRSHDGGARMFR